MVLCPARRMNGPSAGLPTGARSNRPWPCSEASTRSLVELLRCLTGSLEALRARDLAGSQEGNRLTVRDIVLIHIGHMDQHEADIRAIRELHKK